ncbi:MAG: 16S rRNA (uracil(1498)-N(3))-methyltransferase, partial [Gammaproteobacteria bacterium]|nr:16S rRNA (uracil(1498)-N(3))-methyltransferase [Gammaproteobacteria bacterium]
MPIARIYQALSLQPGMQYRLSEKASHHIAHVLRARRGEKLFIFNGEGGEYAAIIQQIDKKGVEVAISHFIAREAEPPVAIHLAQGIARGDKMDFIVQKAVELGAKTIIPLITERCNVKWDEKRKEQRVQHWQSVAISACEQSGRNHLPTITAPCSLNECLVNTTGDLRFVLSPHVHNKLPVCDLTPKANIVLVI